MVVIETHETLEGRVRGSRVFHGGRVRKGDILIERGLILSCAALEGHVVSWHEAGAIIRPEGGPEEEKRERSNT